MKPSAKLVDFIKRWEGFRAVAYRPLPTDRWTVGYGFTFINDKPVVQGDVITQEVADRIMVDHIEKIASQILIPRMPLNLTEQRLDAVISLAFNIGVNKFKSSNTGRLFYLGHDISDRFALYNKSGGTIIPGLVQRRKEERNIYLLADYGIAP